jgi:hypothetical protein
MLAKPEEFGVRTGMQTQPHRMAQFCILTLYSELVNFTYEHFFEYWLGIKSLGQLLIHI